MSSIQLKNFARREESGQVTVVPETFVPIQQRALFILNGVPDGVGLKPNFANAVAFNEPGPVFGWPLVHILSNLSRMARETVESFADCFT